MPNENSNQVSVDDSDPRVRLAVSARCSLMKLLGAPRFRAAAIGLNRWRHWIDTALDSPQDILECEKAEIVPGDTYAAESRSVVMLFAEV